MRDGALRMVRGLRVEQKEVDAASDRRDNARMTQKYLKIQRFTKLYGMC
ncbi:MULTISPECIES: hypothetical protein [unclassified Novosphingobium]|nr:MULTISPECIES: hypothetical protein [unclassified Novosphingobium]